MHQVKVQTSPEMDENTFNGILTRPGCQEQ